MSHLVSSGGEIVRDVENAARARHEHRAPQHSHNVRYVDSRDERLVLRGHISRYILTDLGCKLSQFFFVTSVPHSSRFPLFFTTVSIADLPGPYIPASRKICMGRPLQGGGGNPGEIVTVPG